MLPELGHFALILAMLLAALQGFFGIAGPALGRDRWTAAVTPASRATRPTHGTTIDGRSATDPTSLIDCRT